ncbi:MAG: RluA family pseudouridine synthase [Paludibacteraceae bacterium]|nr:RluA family pseudouridine synthase [Paludibacteraceae bacterium]
MVITNETLEDAKQQVIADIESHTEWREEVSQGKMFGFLITDTGKTLKAYSGQICGRSDWDGYVPAIFDYLQPDGYFKTHEAIITQLNHEAQKCNDSKRLADIKTERKERSQALQRWLFSQFQITNPIGETQSLQQVFDEYAKRNNLRQTIPPSGTGECCAPKLLQYTNTHNLKPLALVEFWYGESPKGEVRHHGMFYEPCQSRCQPIIWWMAGGQEINGLGARYSSGTVFGKLSVLYEDDWFVAVDKPSGMLSVPGKRSLPNVQEIIGCKATHRLDMDTSGVLLTAKTDEAFAAMQRLFAQHDEVRKTYRAMLSHGSPSDAEERGTISLPLSSDFLNRPRQCVDYEHGKEAVTDYIRRGNDILLCPRTGRTHQLRMHCAHRDGLNNPILGDPLYGDTPADRMYLHAAKLEFTHPMTGQHIAIESPAPWKIIN